jgi:guanylate kinase
MQIREQFPETVLVFVTPPTAEELRNRLFGRKTESEEKAMKRLRRAAAEVHSIGEYPYLIINDDVEACAESLHSVISGSWTPEAPDGDHRGGEIITDQAQKEAFAAAFSAGLEKIL